MNREIKFRAWSKKKQGIVWQMPIGLITLSMNKEIISGDIILLQYTGLKDKNGIDEIYEYDIIDHNGLLIGNFYENKDLLKERSNFLITELGTETWKNTEQEAYKRGCRYAK